MQNKFEKNLLNLISIIGVAIYLKQYFINRSLRFDETLIALDIINLPIIQFFNQPLPLFQTAPVGFLLNQKLIINIAGISEYALRLFPLICGCCSIFLFSTLARRRLKDNFLVLIATFSYIFIPTIIYFASDVKPYSPDILCVLLAYVIIAEALMDDIGWTKSIGISLLGAALIWESYPVNFVLSSIGITLFLRTVLQRKLNQIIRILTVLACWSFSFGLYYSFVLHKTLNNNDFFVSYFQKSFIKLTDFNSYLT